MTNFALRENELTFMLPILPHDSSLTISMLYHHIYRMLNNPDVQRAPVCHFQADNAYKDSKNKYNLALFSLLIQLDIFQEIYFSMLPPGHTHEFQDSEFSVVKRAYRSRRTSVLKDFLTLSSNAFAKNNKHRISLDVLVFDWKKWMKPFIPSVKGHVGPHSFMFKRESQTSPVLMTYKNWWIDQDSFHGSEEQPDGLEVIIHFLEIQSHYKSHLLFLQMLLGIPSGNPARLEKLPILQSAYKGIQHTYDNLNQASKEWFTQLFESGTIPDFEDAPTPADYINFDKLKFSVSSSSSSDSVQPQHQPQISMISGIGQSAISERQRVFAVGDLVAVRATKKSKDLYWLAKIKRIIGKNDDGLMEFKCAWLRSQPDGNTVKLSVTPKCTKNSTAVLNENMVLIHGFLLTNRRRLRKETEILLQNTLEADQVEQNSSS